MNLLEMATEFLANSHGVHASESEALADFATKVLAAYNAKLEEWDDCRACADAEQPCRAHRETVRR